MYPHAEAAGHQEQSGAWLDQGGPAPIAPFRNPFKDGALEAFVLIEDDEGWGQVRYLSQDPSGSGDWVLQDLPGKPETATAIVATVEGSTVCAHWTDAAGNLWWNSLTPRGFGNTTSYGLASRIVRLAVAYYTPHNGQPAPVLYGTARGKRSAASGRRLWLSSPSHPMTVYRMPTALERANRFSLSMTGPESWVLDAAVDGTFQRWQGQQGQPVLHGPLPYGTRADRARSVFGAYGMPDAARPAPLFITQDGRPSAWSASAGPSQLCDMAVREVYAVALRSGAALVCLTDDGGNLSVVEQLTGDRDPLPQWNVSRRLTPHPCASSIYPTLHPDDEPAIFALDAGTGVLTVFSRSATGWSCDAAVGFGRRAINRTVSSRGEANQASGLTDLRSLSPTPVI